ncbi:hypothetical protein DXG01_006880 [Tephrocybe rancida]|nr:hypothetical protein DXG01_006880 [Tephrocybe rancida]
MLVSPDSSSIEPSALQSQPAKKRRTPEVSKTLGSAKGYVESLEVRLEKMEKLLNKLLPKVDLAQELDNIDDLDTPPEPSLLPRNDDDILEEELMGKLKRLHVDPPQGRFFGKSSGYQLIQTALDIRSEYVGTPRPPRSILEGKRAHFWYSPSWHPLQTEAKPSLSYSYPDEDLLLSLVAAYFEQINTFFPLFHRPSFEKSVAEGLHHRDVSFGGTLLLVCALGSGYIDDPRVLYDGTTSAHSAGWKWFEQVSVVRKSFIPAPSLSELQIVALAVIFSLSSETPQGCWTLLGMALRMAQEVGAHRRRTLKAPTAEDEHWKRAFCHDVDLPIECDDEYWEHTDPALAFQQPPGKPSVIAYFNCYIRLMDILAYAMRAIYSVKKPMNEHPVTYLDQKIIMDLDSALNNWMDSVPDHYGVPPDDIGDLMCFVVHEEIIHPFLNSDILLELASAGDLTFSDSPSRNKSAATSRTKRPRESDFVADTAAHFAEPRKVAGTRRVSTDVPPGIAPVPSFDQTLNFELPMYGNELGRLPVYGQFNFSESYKRPRRDPAASYTAGPSFKPYSRVSGGPSDNTIPVVNGSTPQMNDYAASVWDTYSLPQSVNAPTLPMPAYPDPSGASAQDGIPFMDSDTLTMWSNAPAGFELNEWGTYITSVDQMTHAPDTFLDWAE